MKKTLVALAALAATGAFAQPVISGNVTYGYAQSTTLGALASGFGVDTAELVFAANEDLGGGMKADAKLTIDSTTRAGVSGGDTVLGLNTNSGRIQFSTAKGADYLSGGVSGVAGIGMDNKVFGARSVRDAISYIVPVAGMTLTLAHQEAADKLGIGAGAAGSAADTVGQRLNVIGLGYAAGALAVNGQYLTYDNRTDASAASSKDVLRAAVSYDLGVAKLGAGYSQATAMNSSTIKDALVGVKVPMGATTFGVQWAQRKGDGSSAIGDGTKNGLGLTAAYALSKRTSFSATFRSWDASTTSAQRNDLTELLLSHSF